MATTARDKSLPALRPTEADTAPPEQTALPICMSPKGFGAFRAALAEPGAVVPEMVEVLRRPAP